MEYSGTTSKKCVIATTVLLLMSILSLGVQGQTDAYETQSLSAKEQSIVTIAAYTAKGNMPFLRTAVSSGLDAGLTVNEIKEVMIQLYAYTGFPRSLNALNTFMDVLKERKAKGINDPAGREPGAVTTTKTKLQRGTAIQTRLVGQPVKGTVYQFAPAIDQFLKEHLFADIFGRDNLDWKTRELATIAALAALGGADNQLRSHFGVGMHNGLTPAQLTGIVSIIQSAIGANEGNAANNVLQAVLAQQAGQQPPTVEASANRPPELIFPTGDKVTNNNFTGHVWLHQMVLPDSLNFTQVGNVTFAPGARSHWHYHPNGQILLAIDGLGYYQEKGHPKRLLKKGDVVKCPPNVLHWHGASRDQPFTQVAITGTQNGPTVWLQPVSEEEYGGTAVMNSANAEQEIINLSKQKWVWMADKNVDSLNMLFDAKSMFVHMGGSWGKEQELNVIKSGGIWYKKAEVYTVTVNIIGNTAILLNDIDLLAVVGTNEVTNPFMVTEVYINHNGQWKMGSLTFSKLTRAVKMK